MSAATRELRAYEEAARRRLSGRVEHLGGDAQELAGSSARHHPWAHLLTGGVVGFLITAGATRAPREPRDPDTRTRRVLRSGYRLARLWVIRRIVSD